MTQQSALSHCWGGGIKRLTESALILQRVRSCFLTGDVGCAGSHCLASVAEVTVDWQLGVNREATWDGCASQPAINQNASYGCMSSHFLPFTELKEQRKWTQSSSRSFPWFLSLHLSPFSKSSFSVCFCLGPSIHHFFSFRPFVPLPSFFRKILPV